MKRTTQKRRQVPPSLASLFFLLLAGAAFGHGNHEHGEQEPIRPGLIGEADWLQGEHRFGEALEKLDLVLQNQPTHAEAWLMKSTVHAVRGEHEEAYAAALPLFGVASPLVAATAAANALSLMSKAEPSYQLLAARLERPGADSAAVRCWAWATLAEIAVRLGRTTEARSHFEAALAADPGDSHTRVTFGEFLIDHGAPEMAWRMLRRSPRNEAERIVAALAAHAIGRPSSYAPQPGSNSRAAARYELDVRGDAGRAWKIARANWNAFQREPADLLLALRAGREAGADVAELEEWISLKGIEDVRIKTARKR